MFKEIEMPFRAAAEQTFNHLATSELVKLGSMVCLEDGHSKRLEVLFECFDGKKHVIGVLGFDPSSEASLKQAAEEAASAANEYAQNRRDRAAASAPINAL